MSFQGINTSGGVHPCIMFFERVSTCIRREYLPNKMCVVEGLDYLECVNRKKQYALHFKLNLELHKNNILELPVYDAEKDQFVSRYQNATEVFEASH